MTRPITLSFTKFLSTSLLECLVACVIHSFVLTTVTSCSTDLFSVFFMGIASITKDICALILWLDVYMSHPMLSLIKPNFFSLHLPLPVILQQRSSLQPSYLSQIIYLQTTHSSPQSSLPLPSDSSHSISGSTTTHVSHSVPESIPEDQDTYSAPV
jgi:hypothetical protein